MEAHNVKCRYCSSEVVVKDDSKYLECPWCHNCFFIDSAEPPSQQAIYRARYIAELERRRLFELEHPTPPTPDRKRLKNPGITMVNGIRITQLRRDCVYAQSLKKRMSLLEKVAQGASAMLSNPKGSRTFYSHVDIPELKCSIILKAIYLGGITVGYHELTDQLYIRPKGSCWQKFNLEEDHEPR